MHRRPILDHDIAVADPAGLHFDAHLPAAGLRDRALDQLELPAGLAHLHRLHQSHVLSSPFLYRGRAIIASSDHMPAPLRIRATASPRASMWNSNPSPCCVPDQFMKKPYCPWTVMIATSMRPASQQPRALSRARWLERSALGPRQIRHIPAAPEGLHQQHAGVDSAPQDIDLIALVRERDSLRGDDLEVVVHSPAVAIREQLERFPGRLYRLPLLLGLLLQDAERGQVVLHLL